MPGLVRLLTDHSGQALFLAQNQVCATFWLSQKPINLMASLAQQEQHGRRKVTARTPPKRKAGTFVLS